MTCPPDYVCKMYPAVQDRIAVFVLVVLIVGLLALMAWETRR